MGTVVIEEEYIYTSDWIKMIFFYFFMTIARFLMIKTFMPVLSSIFAFIYIIVYGYPISKNE